MIGRSPSVASKVILLESPILTFGATLGDLPMLVWDLLKVYLNIYLNFNCGPVGLPILLFSTFKIFHAKMGRSHGPQGIAKSQLVVISMDFVSILYSIIYNYWWFSLLIKLVVNYYFKILDFSNLLLNQSNFDSKWCW